MQGFQLDDGVLDGGPDGLEGGDVTEMVLVGLGEVAGGVVRSYDELSIITFSFLLFSNHFHFHMFVVEKRSARRRAWWQCQPAKKADNVTAGTGRASSH